MDVPKGKSWHTIFPKVFEIDEDTLACRRLFHGNLCFLCFDQMKVLTFECHQNIMRSLLDDLTTIDDGNPATSAVTIGYQLWS
jgi:hypothetical protein